MIAGLNNSGRSNPAQDRLRPGGEPGARLVESAQNFQSRRAGGLCFGGGGEDLFGGGNLSSFCAAVTPSSAARSSCRRVSSAVWPAAMSARASVRRGVGLDAGGFEAGQLGGEEFPPHRRRPVAAG